VKLCLIGAGGHAKVVADAAIAGGHVIIAYADREPVPWMSARWLRTDGEIEGLAPDVGLALGIGGTAPAALVKRSEALARVRGPRPCPPVIHPRAIVADKVPVGDGTQIMAGAMVNPGASIGVGVIVNTGAIVEHGALIGDGCHIAPGAIVLASAVLGDHVMVGAGAVVLPRSTLAAATLVKAGSVH
jgi:sugar O-acyltransferase (sialic acid O-acetyltransferase NeuD family)